MFLRVDYSLVQPVYGDSIYIPGTAKSKPAAAAADNDEDDEAEAATSSAKTSSVAESCSGENISSECDLVTLQSKWSLQQLTLSRSHDVDNT